MRKVASPSASILDVAAAQGNFTLTLAEMGYDVTWNDLREELVGYVQLKHERGAVHFAPGNIFTTRFGRQFDVVLATEIIEHVAHPDQFLMTVAALTKPNGYIIMTTPNGEYFRYRLPRFSDCADPSAFEASQFKPNSDGHIFLLHQDELVALTRRAGLSVLECQLLSNPLTSGHVKLGTILSFLPTRVVLRAERLTQALPGSVKRRVHAQFAVLMKAGGPCGQNSEALP
jgi:2-polyprenyl-6-hydroxyphenyl methylase/3-demethylubiquinone-9 3-methyltransferase